MTISNIDQARLAAAAFGDKTYTTRDIQRAMGGYSNASLCLREILYLGEIEIAGRECGRGHGIIWRTIKLRPVRQPKATPANPIPEHPADEQTLCAMRLHAILDNITRARLEA